jgi:hypothetical protein
MKILKIEETNKNNTIKLLFDGVPFIERARNVVRKSRSDSDFGPG